MDKILYQGQLDYIRSLHKEPDDPLIAEMRDFANKNRIPVLYAESASFLEFLVKLYKPVNLLELGTAIAYTSVRLGRVMPEGAKLTTIEKSANNLKLAQDFVKRSGLSNIDIVFSDAAEFLNNYDSTFDFIFLDADKEDYRTLLDLTLQKMKHGAVIIADNLLWHGFTAAEEIPDSYANSTAKIREFNSYFMSHPDLDTVLIPVGDGLGLGIRR